MITISGFTFVRNGFQMGYPFLPSIRSLLPLVDELIVVVGDSEDGTRTAIENLGADKIRIVDSVWSEEKRQNGVIFKEQSNLGLVEGTGDWLFHLQADEVLHEDDYARIRTALVDADQQDDVDGLLFPFYHFWGDYQHHRATRRTHNWEIRAFKNNRKIQSYKDSQGFRRYPTPASTGQKLTVIPVQAPIYHYSYTRHPKLMRRKSNYFHRFWHSNAWLTQHTNERPFDYNEVDCLEHFNGSHPALMQTIITQKDWDFEYDPSRSTMSLKDRLLYRIEKHFGWRLFGYQNYKLKS